MAQREWFDKDYYAVLGVPPTATPKELTKAYRALARAHHPDATASASDTDRAASEERFKEISAAYDVLGDADKRKEYDEVRAMGPAAGGFTGGPFGGTGQPRGASSFRFDADSADLNDVLSGIFGGGATRARGRSRGQAGPRRGGDLEAELHLSFDDAVHGVTTTVHLSSDAVCSHCHGVGAEPGTAPTTCPTCGGSGVVAENQGPFSFSTPCLRCGGKGLLIEHPCSVCGGSGSERRARAVKVRIPAGVHDGQRIRVKGRGTPGMQGGPAGDLYVVTRVGAHALFGRRDDHLTLTVPITFPEAALGADLAVPTLDGPAVTVRIPAGTRSGRTFRVKGKGVTRGSSVGDLLVTVEVAVPARLSTAERKAVQALAEATPESPRAHLGV